MLKPDQMTDNCNVNVCYYGDELYAITESPNLQRIDPSSLDSEEKVWSHLYTKMQKNKSYTIVNLIDVEYQSMICYYEYLF